MIAVSLRLPPAWYDFRFKLFCFRERIGAAAGDDGARRRAATRRVFARAILPRCPNWVRGHQLLGDAELALLQLGDRAGRERSIVALRTSALAIGKLATTGEQRAESARLLAMAEHVQQHYDKAIELFQPFLDDDFLNALDEERRLEVLEHFGAALLACGQQQEARGVLSRIPLDKRSSEVEAAFSFFERPPEQSPSARP